MTLFTLPITLDEDRPREPTTVPTPLSPHPSKSAHRHSPVAQTPANDQHVEPSLATEPAPPIDWRAEIDKSVLAQEQHYNIERNRRSLDGWPASPLDTARDKPSCPYEKCEPGWGENLGVFSSSLHSKAGRIDTITNDTGTLSNGSPNMGVSESVVWINNWCYSILTSPDPLRRGMSKCFFPLGKSPARGDLFDHMNENRPPPSHETEDVPYLSYGFTLGAARHPP